MPLKLLIALFILLAQINSAGTDSASYNQTKHFYIMQEAWHTGFVIDVSTIPDTLEPLAHFKRNNQFIEVGWGDEAFFQTPKTRVRLVLKAVLVPSQAALRVRGLWAHPAELYGQHTALFRVECTPEQYNLLLSFISDSFVVGQDGKAILSDYRANNRNFYLAQRSYHLFRTCNTWAALGLQQSFFDVRYACVLTRRQLVRQLRRINAQEQ